MANEHIYSLIQSLSDKESRTVEDYLNSIAFLSGAPEESKQYKLYKLVRAMEVIDEQELKITLKTSNLTSLKWHLNEKVLEALTLDKNIFNKSLFSEVDQTMFRLKKKMLTFRILYRSRNQKKTDTIHNLLNEIISEGIKNEVYDIVVEALIAKKYFKSIRSGHKELQLINEQIDFYDFCFKSLIYANDSYYTFILDQTFVREFSERQLLTMLEDAIKKIQNDLKISKSKQVEYYLHILQFAYFEKKEDYKRSIEYCNKLIQFLKDNPLVNRTERIGFVMDNLSQFKTYLHEYNQAAKDAKTAQTYYSQNSFNFLMSKEQEFLANFYGNDIEDAKECINYLLKHSTYDSGSFRKSKFEYYRACLNFEERNFKEVLQQLNRTFEIEKDKTRWNISIRILHIMTHLELNKIDEAEKALESLRKYSERVQKTDVISSRNLKILELLRSIEKQGFELKSTNKIGVNLLKSLSETHSESSWKPFTAELIPFHKWISAKQKKS